MRPHHEQQHLHQPELWLTGGLRPLGFSLLVHTSWKGMGHLITLTVFS